MIHPMKLRPRPFEDIKAGHKKIESRLFDEKRRHIQAGDEIDFFKLQDLQETVRVRVLELRTFPTFRELGEAFPLADFGMEKVATVQDYADAMHEIYDEEEEKAVGVVALRIEVVTEPLD